MRISANPEDLGFIEMRNRFYKVFLNNKLVNSDVVTADEEKGFIIILSKDKHGKYILKNNIIVQETIKGKVRVEEINK